MPTNGPPTTVRAGWSLSRPVRCPWLCFRVSAPGLPRARCINAWRLALLVMAWAQASSRCPPSREAACAATGCARAASAATPTRALGARVARQTAPSLRLHAPPTTRTRRVAATACVSWRRERVTALARCVPVVLAAPLCGYSCTARDVTCVRVAGGLRRRRVQRVRARLPKPRGRWLRVGRSRPVGMRHVAMERLEPAAVFPTSRRLRLPGHAA